MKRAFPIAAVFLLAGCSPPAEQPSPPAVELSNETENVAVTVRLPKSRLPVTEPLRLSIEVEVDESRQVEFPESIGSTEDFGFGAGEVSNPRLLDNSRVAYERVYELEPYLPGEYSVGPFEVEHWPKGAPGERETVAVEAVTVTIDSVLLTAEDEAELRDIRDPVQPPPPYWSLAAAALGAAAAGALAYWFWRRRRRETQADGSLPPPPPPHVAALAALERLVHDGLIERGEYKLFYGLLSNILRRYVEDRFGIRAPERTTEEFLRELKSGSALGPAHQGLLKMFLEHSDLVKFAEMRPAEEDVERSVSLCRRFIEETVPCGLEVEESIDA